MSLLFRSAGLLTALQGFLVVFSSTVSQAQTIVYQDSFDGDGLGINTSIGGGLTNRTIFAHSWADNGNLQFNTTGTHFQRRAIAFSDNTFQSAGGFELSINYFNSSYGGASGLAFGLVRDDTDLSTYSGFNPFGDASLYGFGATTDAGNLRFVDGSSATTLDSGAPLPLGTDTEVVLSFLANDSGGANWSWSVGGTDRNSGTISAFDFNSSYHFVAYGQDDQGNKRINSVSLTAIPLPIMVQVDNAAIAQLIGSAIPSNIAAGQVASQVHGTALRDLNNRIFKLRNRISSGGGFARIDQSRGREVSASRLYRLERELQVESTINLNGPARTGNSEGAVYDTAVVDDENPLVPAVTMQAGAGNYGSHGLEAFASFDYGKYDLDPLGQNAGVESRTTAGTVGVEYVASPNLAVGLGYTNVQNENQLSGGLGSIDLDGNAVSAYASYFQNNLWGDLLYSYGDYEASVNRNTLIGSTVTARPNVDAHQTTLNLGYNLPADDRFNHGPTFRADYSRGKLEGYTERGDPRANTTFQTQQYESMITTLGYQLNWRHDTPWGAILPQFRLGYSRENNDQETNVSGTLQNSPITFIQGGNVIGTGATRTATLNREDPGEGWMEFGAGFGFEFNNNFSLTVDYQGRFFQQDAQLHMATLKGGWRF